MPNLAGIADHNGAQAEALATGYRSLDRRAIYPEIYAITDKAAKEGQSLRILDIGAGAGNDAIEMARSGHRIVAVEPSDLRAIAQRDHAHPHIDYRDGQLPALTCLDRNETFDMVMMSAVWQYIDPQERVPSLTRIAHALKPGGSLVLTYPSPPSRDHQFEASPEMLRNELAAANATLPRHRQLILAGEPQILPDSRGRTSADGRPIQFYTYLLKAGHRQAITPRDGWTTGR